MKRINDHNQRFAEGKETYDMSINDFTERIVEFSRRCEAKQNEILPLFEFLSEIKVLKTIVPNWTFK